MRGYLPVTAEEISAFHKTGLMECGPLYAPTIKFLTANNDLDEEQGEYLLSMVYLMGTPLRRKARKQMEERECAQLETEPPQSTGEPDAGRHAPSLSEDTAVAPVRKEP